MDFAILGPVEVIRDGIAMPIGGAGRRTVLARLLIDAGRTVATDSIIEDVWNGQPPATAHKTLQKYISELRKTIGPHRLVTTANGYRLDAEDLDVRRFEALIADGAYEDALALWRGTPLADIDAPFVVPERTRLEDLRLVAVEGRF